MQHNQRMEKEKPREGTRTSPVPKLDFHSQDSLTKTSDLLQTLCTEQLHIRINSSKEYTKQGSKLINESLYQKYLDVLEIEPPARQHIGILSLGQK